MQRDSIFPDQFGTENGCSNQRAWKSLDVIGVRFPKHHQTVSAGSMYKITECHESKWKMPLK